MRSLHALRARVTGTVTTRDSVESSNIDADSASIGIILCENKFPLQILPSWKKILLTNGSEGK
jgi:hypothetical protein